MPYSSGPNDGDDIYHPDHGRYVLMASPGKGTMEFLGFSKVYYDKKDHTMRDKDESRADDFISISGSKMRKLAALGAKPCAIAHRVRDRVHRVRVHRVRDRASSPPSAPSRAP